MRAAIVVVGVLIGLVVIDRLALRAEARGWIYWRRSTHRPSLTAGALGAVDEVLQPERHAAHVEWETRRELRHQDERADPDRPD